MSDSPQPRARILVVDDTPDNLKLLDDVLGKEGYQVLTLPSGTMALKAAQKAPPDLILLDVLMPKMDGFEVCRRLKSDPALANIPVIFLSALNDTQQKLEGFRVGGVDYIGKPVAIEEVKARVRTHLQLQDLRRALERQNRELETAFQQLHAAHKELEIFSYSVSHDLRAPLRNLTSLAHLLVQDHGPHLPEDGRKLLDLIVRKVKQMDQLIEDLLAFACLNRHTLKIESVDLDPLVRQVVQELQPLARGRQVNFRLHPLPQIQGDRALLFQVFMNLLGNAVKYTRPRKVAVIEVTGSTQKGEHFLRVTDNGVGFDMKFANKLFSVFQRLHTDSQFEGTGIGLAIVQRIVQRHGGRTWAESTPDAGASFHVALPTTPAPSPTDA